MTKKTRQRWLSTKRMVASLSYYEWPLVGALATASFIAGCVGYWQLLHDQSDYGLWDIPYLAIQFFLLEASDPSAHWPWYMQVARYLAPLTLLYTAVKAVFNQLGMHLGLFFLRFHAYRYVIICGLGETGSRLALDYARNSDLIVIAIEPDKANPYAPALRAEGITILTGSALDSQFLLRARLPKAKLVFAFTGNDERNIAIGKLVERLMRKNLKPQSDLLTGKSVHQQPLQCFLAVEHPDLYEVFESHPFFNTHTSQLQIQVFNQTKTVARNVMQKCAPDLYYRPHKKEDAPMHILVLGFEALAREILIEYTVSAHYFDRRKPKATVICPKSSADLIPKYLRRFPQLYKALDLNIVIDDPLTLSENRWRQLQENSNFTLLYVAMQKDVEAVLSGRRLHQFSLQNNDKLFFIICLNQQTLLADVLDDDFEPINEHKSLLTPESRIEYFETLDETISHEVIVEQVLDTTARCIHDEYLEQLYARGERIEQNASLVSWDQLPPHKKVANQHAASHMDVKLRLAGYCRGRGRNTRFPFPPNANMLELLAEVEHRRWMADKWVAGYDFGPVRDEARKLHPDLVDWEQLSEADKEKDRDNIRRISRLLSMQHQHPCPINQLENTPDQ